MLLFSDNETLYTTVKSDELKIMYVKSHRNRYKVILKLKIIIYSK